MSLWAPKSWVTPGKPFQFKISGNAENSTLFTMVQQGKMPKQGPKLTGAQLDIIKSWIVAGAQNN